MALLVGCPKGHSYVQSDRYENWPEGAPTCPICFREWQKNNREDPLIKWLEDLILQLENPEVPEPIDEYGRGWANGAADTQEYVVKKLKEALEQYKREL